MQLKKPSKKTAKPAEQAQSVAAVEKETAAAKPRSVRSSKKKSELSDMASATHHHKTTSTSLSSAVNKAVENPTQPVTRETIAELAYSYFVERNFAHGNHEEDWLRAEKSLGLR
jgi:cell division septation protein DedD